jgi:SAM-dependent methyltransferase
VTRCPVCGDRRAAAVWSLCDRYYPTPGVFEVRRCRPCRSTFVADPPADLRPYYGAFYYSYDPQPPVRKAGLKPWIKRRVAASPGLTRLVEVLPGRAPVDERLAAAPPRPGARVLDVGCGSGRALDAYRSAGWATFGVELDEAAARAARQRGHEVVAGPFGSLDPPCGPFDLVRLSHVLEHLPDPLGALHRATGLVAPGGSVLVELPNLDGVLARVSGAAWWQLDPPRHLAIPRRAHLLAPLAGRFPIVAVSTYSTGQGMARTWFMWRERGRGPAGGRMWRMGEPWVPRGYRVLELAAEPLAVLTDLLARGDNLRILASGARPA